MKYFTLLIICIALFSCNSTDGRTTGESGVRVFNDPFRGFVRHSNPSSGYLDGQGFLDLTSVTLEVYADQTNGKVSTGLAAIIDSDTWLYILEGESLILIVDGQPMRFTAPTSSLNSNTPNNGITRFNEENHYPITTSQIKAIAEASTVKVRVYTHGGTVTREFGQKHLNSFKIFYKDVVLKHGIVSIP